MLRFVQVARAGYRAKLLSCHSRVYGRVASTDRRSNGETDEYTTTRYPDQPRVGVGVVVLRKGRQTCQTEVRLSGICNVLEPNSNRCAPLRSSSINRCCLSSVAKSQTRCRLHVSMHVSLLTKWIYMAVWEPCSLASPPRATYI